MSRVVIIGAGVIGLATAHQLRERDHEVILIDSGDPGNGSSDGNTGWVVPALSSPIPAPGLVSQSVRWMLDSDSPLYIKPSAVLRLAPFLWKMRRYCNERDYARGRAAAARLNRRTMEAFDGLLGSGLDFEMHQKGLTFVAKDPHYLDDIEEDVEAISRYGFEAGERLGPSQIRDLEPTLSSDVVGGFHVPDQRHIRPESLIAALRDYCDAHGVEIRSNTRVTGMREDKSGTRIDAVISTVGEISADYFVICAGAASGQVARSLGHQIPMEAGTGYSITTPSAVFDLGSPLYLCDAKVACSPFEGNTRLAGTMEFSGINGPSDMKRCAAIKRSAQSFFPDLPENAVQNQWSGMRPITPDGLPVIGFLPNSENALISSGHGMLGVTLAPVSAEAIADLITSGTSSDDLTSVDPGRFG